mmetsp:Transcript_68959/g.128772  ORF Transcript_68959/g.128772 Transcript_68959/m.128772 type:complete len:1088 (+) Transcript_68959:82-3345(+)
MVQMTGNSKLNPLQVVCRLRPLSDQERKATPVPTVTAISERREVVVTTASAGRQVQSSFAFNDVLNSFSSQSEVFDATVRPMVKDVCGGFEGVAFVYGQTGSGKTHTCEGTVEGRDSHGLVVRAAEAVMQELMSGAYTHATITMSCAEVYNEELNDFLSTQKGEIKQAGETLTEVKLTGGNDVLEVLRAVKAKRRVADMKVHARSASAHTVYTLRVLNRQRVPGGEYENEGRLHIVDLAGSELAKRDLGHSPRGHSPRSPREIVDDGKRTLNQSLLTLKRVLANYHDASARIPVKDSRLTRHLHDVLCGACHMVLLVTVSPAQQCVEETIATLTYAEQAMSKATTPREQVQQQAHPENEHRLQLQQQQQQLQLAQQQQQQQQQEHEKQLQLQQQQVTKACEAAAAELNDAAGRLQAVESSTQKAAGHAAETLARTSKAVASQTSVVQEHADQVRKLLHGRSEMLSSGIRAVARDIGIAEMNAVSAEAAFVERVQNSVGVPLLSLGEVVHAASVACDAHTASVERASTFIAAEASAAVARRHGMRGELHLLAEAHSASSHGAAPLQELLESLGKVLSKEGSGSSAALGMVMDELAQNKRSLVDTSSTGEATLTALSSRSDENFADAWSQVDKMLGSIEETVGDDIVTARMDLLTDQAKVTAVSTFTRKLSIVLSAMLCARNSIETEVAALRQQRRDEEEVLATLAQQREALAADCQKAEAHLASVTAELESCKQSLVELEDEQAAKRDAIVRNVTSSVESLLRLEFADMEKRFGKHSEDVRTRLATSAEHCQATSTTVRKAQSRATHLASEAEQQVNAWALGAASVCDGISAAQASSELAAKEMEGAAHECMGKLASTIKQLRAAQTNSKSQWAATTQDVATAVAAWKDRSRKVAASLDDVASRSKTSADALSALHEEGVGHHRAAARHASTRAGEDVRLSSAFGTLMARHDELENIEAAAEGERQQSLAALSDSAEAASADVARCAPLVAKLGEAADNLATETAAEGRCQRKAINLAKGAVENLTVQSEALLARASDGSPLEVVQQMCGAAEEMARLAVAGLGEVAESAGATAVTAAGLAQAQRCLG